MYVITPNALHREHTESAAKAGKHVLCEKPMATNSKDAEAMIKACADAKKLLMIGCRAQYEPYNLRAIEMCRTGKLGRIVSVTSDHGRTANPAEKRDRWHLKKALSGGGSLPNIGIYSLCRKRTSSRFNWIISRSVFAPASPPKTPGEEGLHDVRYIEAICRAVKEGIPVKS